MTSAAGLACNLCVCVSFLQAVAVSPCSFGVLASTGFNSCIWVVTEDVFTTDALEITLELFFSFCLATLLDTLVQID